MRQALRRNPTRQRVSQAGTIPAPVKGWMAKDSIADMPPDSAIKLTNWFPEATTIRLRRGSVMWAKNLGGACTTLMVWAGPLSNKLFAVGGGKIWDVTTQSSDEETIWDAFAGSTAPLTTWDNAPETDWDADGQDNKVDTGFTSADDWWSWVNFSNSGGNYLICVNGANDRLIYDGTTWSTLPAITGPVSVNRLCQVFIHKRRLWFIEAGSTRAWYLDTDAIGGTATQLDLGPMMSRGGYLMLGGSWTIDGGNGPDDYCYFLSSEGQMIIYQGTNPSDAASWGIKGVFQIGRPLGRRASVNVGSDVAIICEDGVVSMAASLQLDRSSSQKASITKNIQSAFNQAVRLYGDLQGWQAIPYPAGTMAIINVPVAASSNSVQYVMNTITGAWCEFDGMNAACWVQMDGKLYFGTWDGAVCLADAGISDYGSDRLSGSVVTAFSYLAPKAQMKQMKMLRPVIQTDSALQPAVDVSVDFDVKSPEAQITVAAPLGALWDIAIWDEAVWDDPATVSLKWTTVFGLGYAFAATMNVSVAPAAGRNIDLGGANVRVVSFDAIYEAGALL